jgi:ABC-type multidrug transport system fused ATPase/permease subunit
MIASLEARALDFGYPRHPVGHGVSLALRTGEVVALLVGLAICTFLLRGGRSIAR